MRKQARLVQEADLEHKLIVEERPEVAVPLSAPQGDLAHAHIAPHPVHHILSRHSQSAHTYGLP